MRVPRLIDFTQQLLTLAEHPDIVSIEPYDEPGTELKPSGVKVTMRDRSVVYLKVTRTSGPGGDKFDQPEEVPYPDYQVPSNLKELLHGQ